MATSQVGCCKSELRYLKHWYRLLCPGLVKPILGHSFGRSWYIYEAFPYSEYIFPLNYEALKTQFLLWFYFYSRKELESALIPLRVSVHKSITYRYSWNQKIYEKFQWLLLANRSCGRWCQGVLCVIQSLLHPDFGCVTRFAEWFCVRPSFPFSPSPLPHLKSPLP